MAYPPPIDLATVIEDTVCWWYTEDGPCFEPATTTRFDPVRSAWLPVCDDHKRRIPNR